MDVVRSEVDTHHVLASFDRMVLTKAGASFANLPKHLQSIRAVTAQEEETTYDAENNWTLPDNDEARLLFTQVYEDSTFNGAKKFHLGLFFAAAVSLQQKDIPSVKDLAKAVWRECDRDSRAKILGYISDNDKLSVAKEIFARVKEVLKKRVAENTIVVIAAVKVPEVVEYMFANKGQFPL